MAPFSFLYFSMRLGSCTAVLLVRATGIAAAELSLQTKHNPSPGDHGFPERVVLRRLLLALALCGCHGAAAA
jgi:hypothetical protein